MLDQQEKLWDYDAVEPGQAGQPTVVAITAENIAEYARLSQNPQYSNASIAMPMRWWRWWRWQPRTVCPARPVLHESETIPGLKTLAKTVSPRGTVISCHFPICYSY